MVPLPDATTNAVSAAGHAPRRRRRACTWRRLRVAAATGLAAAAAAATGCARDPSPEQLRATLVQHPEVLYAAIQAHPAEFMDVVTKAARLAQAGQQARTAADERRRIDEEMRAPKVPAIERRAVLGNPSAPVTVVEYTDFECPFCRRESDVLVQLMKKHGDSVRLVVKQTPLVDIHPHAMGAALMYEAIARQDPNKAFRFYDYVYANQEGLAGGEPFLESAAAHAGADVARAVRDARGDAVKAVVAADLDEARRFGFTGTPGFLVNGVTLQGAYPLPALEQVIARVTGAPFDTTAMPLASAGSSSSSSSNSSSSISSSSSGSSGVGRSGGGGGAAAQETHPPPP